MSSILQLVVALATLIILHEIGHFIAARLVKVDVEEFGIGFPPRFARLWRRKGEIHISGKQVTIPMGTKALMDLEKSMWVDAVTRQSEDGGYVLDNLTILDPKLDDLESRVEIVDDKVHLRGELTHVKAGMLFSLNILPLGGFVRMKGETDPDDPGGLHAASPWARLAIYFAGPLMNLLVGVLLYTFMFTQTGIPDFTKVLVVGISPDSPAEQVGMLEGDIISLAAGQAIDSTDTLRDTIYANLGEEIIIAVERGEEQFEFSLVPRENPPEGEGAIGIIMSNPVQNVGWLSAIPLGTQATFQHSLLLATLPAQVMRGSIDPSLARPIGYKGMYDLYQNVSEMESPIPASPVNLFILQFFASVTISLGALNLLPIPGLDGGRIIFTLPEIIIRRRIPVEWQNMINFISITALIALFIYINMLDFTNPVQIP